MSSGAQFQIDTLSLGGAEEEIKAAKEDNEKVRTSNTSSFERPKGVAGMARKGAQILDGPKD